MIGETGERKSAVATPDGKSRKKKKKELLRRLCICIVHVCEIIHNEELFFNAIPFENSYYFIS